MTIRFGVLKDIPLRKAWQNEAQEFTPWLADNIDKLSEAVGIPLESEGREVKVEQFYADILARNTQDDTAVLIENQLESSDHNHLGQILTYLAGLEARTVIWIASDFKDAHRSAVRWLNDNTTDEFAFFAIQVRVVRIGNSPVAPIFDVLERPSNWERQLRTVTRSDLTEKGQFRREFWAHYAEQYPEDGIRPEWAGANFWHTIGKAELRISQFISQEAVGVFLCGYHGENADDVFPKVQRYESMLMDNLGIELGKPSWGSNYAHTRLRIDTRDPENWVEMINWLHEHLRIYRKVLTEVSL